jgi:dTDP-4-amino-4,6-dideoxygalactose transaminase
MIRLSVPDIGESEFDQVKMVLQSGYLVQGDQVQLFEQKIADYLGVRYSIAVSSGTAALHLALIAIGVGQNDEVIVPDLTFPATSNVVELVGATTRFADVDNQNFCINPSQIEDLINKNTKVIMPVHEFGHTANMDLIMDLARKYNLNVIEDAACALGSEFNGNKAGTIGDVGCYSFHPRKSITTGEGGIIVTNNEKLAEKMFILRNHGIQYRNGKPYFVAPGFNYRMTNIQGALGNIQMDKLVPLLERRLEIAKIYDHELQAVPGLHIPVTSNYCKHSYQTYHVILDKKINRDHVIRLLSQEGIETNFGAYAVHKQPYYKQKYGLEDMHFPISLNAHYHGLAIPLHSKLSHSEIKFIIEKLSTVLKYSLK